MIAKKKKGGEISNSFEACDLFSSAIFSANGHEPERSRDLACEGL